MKFCIKHEIEGRLRIHLVQKTMSYAQADTLLYYLQNISGVTFAKVYERTADALIRYEGSREELIGALRRFRYENVKLPKGYLETSGRELNARFQENLVMKTVCRYAGKLFLPCPVRYGYIAVRSLKYLYKGIQVLGQGKIEVPVLDAAAIGVSVLRKDFETAGSIMFLLGIGELLEDGHIKSLWMILQGRCL